MVNLELLENILAFDVCKNSDYFSNYRWFYEIRFFKQKSIKIGFGFGIGRHLEFSRQNLKGLNYSMGQYLKNCILK
jgi:hypothetical protein